MSSSGTTRRTGGWRFTPYILIHLGMMPSSATDRGTRSGRTAAASRPRWGRARPPPRQRGRTSSTTGRGGPRVSASRWRWPRSSCPRLRPRRTRSWPRPRPRQTRLWVVAEAAHTAEDARRPSHRVAPLRSISPPLPRLPSPSLPPSGVGAPWSGTPTRACSWRSSLARGSAPGNPNAGATETRGWTGAARGAYSVVFFSLVCLLSSVLLPSLLFFFYNDLFLRGVQNTV